MNAHDYLTEKTLRERREAHAAACAGLEDDYLIQVAFAKPAPVAPMQSPMQEGWLFKRQAG